MLWTVFAGCGAELLTVSMQQSSDAVIIGVPEIPEIPDDLPEGYDDLEDVGDLDPSEVDPAAALEALGLDDWLDGFDDQMLADRGIDEGDVSEITIVGLTIEVVDSHDESGVDLTFLDSLELWVSADGVREQKLAGATRFLAGVTSVELVSDPVDLAPFALASGMSIRTVADGWPPEIDTTLRATVHVEVGLTAEGLLGQLDEL
jgi:hypothetical protein